MTRQTISLLAILAISSPAAPLVMLDPASETDLAIWGRKSNTTVALLPTGAGDGSRALALTIDPAEFNYGWSHRAFPDQDFASASGVHGFYRSPHGAHGKMVSHIIIGGQEGIPPSYFGTTVGLLEDSLGEWVEFYLPFSKYRYERGPEKRFTPSQLSPTVRLQFLTSIDSRKPMTIELSGLDILDSEDAGALARRLSLAHTQRQLLPMNALSPVPHPRLLLTPDRIESYRAKATAGGEVQAVYEHLLACADSVLVRIDPSNPLPGVLTYTEDTEIKGHERRARFEGILNRAVTPVETLAAAYRLTGDERYGKHAAALAVSMARRLTTHDPVISEGFYYTRTFYVRALAFSYDWLWELLSVDERRDVQTTLLGFVLDIHEQSQSAGWGRRPLHRVWNWDPGLMGACGLGMLALEGETHVAEKAIIFDCRRHLRDYLTLGIDSDGCCHEGPNYIGYGIGAGVEFVEVLRRQDRGDLFTETNYHLIPPWLTADMLPDGKRWNNLSDCSHGQAPYPVYSYACGRFAELAKHDLRRLNERWPTHSQVSSPGFLQTFSETPGNRPLSYPTLASLMGWIWQHGPGNLPADSYGGPRALAHVLLYEPCPVIDNPASVLPLGALFRGRGLAVSRTGFSPEDWHLAVEAGPHAAGHDQCDKGTFTLRAFGADLVIDSGYGNDGDLRKSGSSFAHNVVLIDGEGQPMRYHNQSGGRITGFHHSALVDWIRVDASEAWGTRYDGDWTPSTTAPVLRANRTFLFVRPSPAMPGYLVIWDDIAKDTAEHDYTWQWHIPPNRQFDTTSDTWRCVPATLSLAALTSTVGGPAGSAEFRFLVPDAGEYCAYGLTRAGGSDPGKSDSFFIALDDGPELTWDTTNTSTFSWSSVRDRGETSARIFTLTAGDHVLRLKQREPEADLVRLIVLPAGAPEPIAPGLIPEDSITMDAADAVMGAAPFTMRPKGSAISATEAMLDATLVHPEKGAVVTDWFMTSREGAHPRLQYTVRKSQPNFVAIMVPRLPNMPELNVQPLELEGGMGVTVSNGTIMDRVVFAREEASGAGMVVSGSVAFVRSTNGNVSAGALFDGTELTVNGKTLCHRNAPGIDVRRDLAE